MTTPDADADQAAKVRATFDYADGALIHKLDTRGGRIKGCAAAGTLTEKGYLKVRFAGRPHKAHRLIFLWHFGWPPEMIDHIDGNKSNNRIENLRPCDKSQNGMNRHSAIGSTGYRNVYRRRSTYYVSLRKNGEQVSIGKFKSIEDANAAAEVARREHYGEFA